MVLRWTSARRTGLASVLMVALAAGAAAQDAGPAPAPAPTTLLPKPGTLYGRPDTEAAMRLAPVPPPPEPLALDKLPVAQLQVPKGFHIEVFASGIADARSLRVGDKGTVFVGNRVRDKVWAIYNKDGKRTQKPIASGLYRPNGLAFHEGTLYIAELSRITRIERVEDNLDEPPEPTPVYDDLPKDEQNGWRYIAVGPDNKLYVAVGLPCNNCIPDDAHGVIRRLNLDGSGAEVVARGVRQSVGFDWNPATKELYFTDNGRDWLSEDLPHDELNRLTKPGQHFGAPYCYQGNVPDAELGWGRSCGEFVPPVALMGPHAAPLGMRFYSGTMFPAEYRGAIFVARHGSWNRTEKLGGDIVAVKLNRDGTVKSVDPFITGFIVDNKYIGRPVDVQPMRDGSLLISDDYAGAVYRVTYGPPPRTAGAR
jgi:glucose/arabinose dehydrogenase